MRATRAIPYDDSPYVEVPVGADAEVRGALLSRPEVLAVDPVAERRTAAVSPTDPLYPQQWYLPTIGMPDGWELRQGSGVGIAIVDNGVAADRPDLAGRVEQGWDALTKGPLVAGTDSDLGGHGTAVAGLAAASHDDGGIAGVDSSARIHPVRVFDHEGCFVEGQPYLDALDWVADHADDLGIRVANFSLGGGEIPGEAEAITRLLDAGVVVVAAMGNDGDTEPAGRRRSLRPCPRSSPSVPPGPTTGSPATRTRAATSTVAAPAAIRAAPPLATC